jgi:hypothetical protein
VDRKRPPTPRTVRDLPGAARRELRLAWAAAGITWFFWLGREDQGLGGVFFLSALVCLALALTLLRSGDRGRGWPVVVGVLGGAAVPLAAVVLMFLKVSLHTHPEPDFGLQDVVVALQRTPLWAVAGFLAGAAAALLRMQDRL